MLSDWEIKNIVLKTAELRESHTAAHVAECIMGILSDFDINRESVLAVTTNNAGNYVNAVEDHLKAVDVPCIAHTLNLAVLKGLRVRAVERPINRLKLTAAHFNKSPAHSYLLEEKQHLLGVKPSALINDCPTRWNSTFDMITRALEQQSPVAAVIFDKKLSHLELNTTDWTLMEQVNAPIIIIIRLQAESLLKIFCIRF